MRVSILSNCTLKTRLFSHLTNLPDMSTKHNLTELPQLPTPGERLAEMIEKQGQYLADVAASKLYAKRGNLKDIATVCTEMISNMQEYYNNWSQEKPVPVQQKVTRRVVEEVREPVPALDNSWLPGAAEKAMYGEAG